MSNYIGVLVVNKLEIMLLSLFLGMVLEGLYNLPRSKLRPILAASCSYQRQTFFRQNEAGNMKFLVRDTVGDKCTKFLFEVTSTIPNSFRSVLMASTIEDNM